MSKLITIEDGYEIRLGQKNPSCYPCCTADLRALPTWQDPGGDGTVYPCGDDCPFMKQFINEDKDEDIETNHSDGRA